MDERRRSVDLSAPIPALVTAWRKRESTLAPRRLAPRAGQPGGSGQTVRHTRGDGRTGRYNDTVKKLAFYTCRRFRHPDCPNRPVTTAVAYHLRYRNRDLHPTHQ